MEYKIVLLLLIVSSSAYAATYGTCVVNTGVYNCMPTSECVFSGGTPQEHTDCSFSTNSNDETVCCVTSSTSPEATSSTCDSAGGQCIRIGECQGTIPTKESYTCPEGTYCCKDATEPQPTQYGKCDAPQDDYYCTKLQNGACLQQGYSPVPGLCPRYPNDIQCCIPEEQASTGNPYGKCNNGQGDFGEYDCTKVTRKGNTYVCPQEGFTPVAGFCGGATWIQCCVPQEVREQKFESGEYKKCAWPLNQYDCKDIDACESSGGISYSRYCPGAANIQCCVPEKDHVQKKYVIDNAKVIGDATEKQISDILETLDNENKFAYDNQIKAPVVIQIEKDNAAVNGDFVKKRYQELRLDKINPSGIILLNLKNLNGTISTDTSSHEMFVYSFNKNFNRELNLIVFNDETNKRLLDNKKYEEALLEIAKDVQKYVQAYSNVVEAVKKFSEDESCYSFSKLVGTIAQGLDLPESQKTIVLNQALEDSDKVCSNLWKKGVTAELQDEIKDIENAINDIPRWENEVPPCDVSLNNKYACIARSDGSYYVGKCTSINLYATATTTGIAAGDSCISAGPGVDDYFSLTQGQIRCANYVSNVPRLTSPGTVLPKYDGYALVECTGTWNTGNPSNPNFKAYRSQEECSNVCNTNSGVKNLCTEPLIQAKAYTSQNQEIANGATLQQWDSGIVVRSVNQNPNVKTLDREVHHVIKVRTFRGSQLLADEVWDCLDARTCEYLPRDTRPGVEVQYWSEIYFIETNGQKTYIRSPSSGLYSFKILGPTEPYTGTVYTRDERFSEWQGAGSQRFATFSECRKDCGISLDCVEQKESETPLDISTDNFIKDMRGGVKTASLQKEKEMLSNILSCYSSSLLKNALGACISEKAPNIGGLKTEFGAAIAGEVVTDYSYYAATNARLLMLREVESKLEDYDKDPLRTVCNAAFAAAQKIEADGLSVIPPYTLGLHQTEPVASQGGDPQKIRNAYSLVAERCNGIEEYKSKVTIARDKIKSTKNSFMTGVMNVVESLAEPTNLKILGATVAVTVATTFIPAASFAGAARIQTGVKAAHTIVGAYFAYEMASGLRVSVARCYDAGLSSEECGEAITQGVLLAALMKSTYKSGKATWETASSIPRLQLLEADAAKLKTFIGFNEKNIKALDDRIAVEKGLYERSDKRRALPIAQKKYIEQLERENNKLKKETEEMKKLLEKDNTRVLKLVDLTLEQGSLSQKNVAPRYEVLKRELKSVIEERKKSGRRVACKTGLITGFAPCSGAPDEDIGDVIFKRLSDILPDERKGKTGDLAEIDPGQPTVILRPATVQNSPILELLDSYERSLRKVKLAETDAFAIANPTKLGGETFAVPSGEALRVLNENRAKLVAGEVSIDSVIAEMKEAAAAVDPRRIDGFDANRYVKNLDDGLKIRNSKSLGELLDDIENDARSIETVPPEIAEPVPVTPRTEGTGLSTVPKEDGVPYDVKMLSDAQALEMFEVRSGQSIFVDQPVVSGDAIAIRNFFTKAENVPVVSNVLRDIGIEGADVEIQVQPRAGGASKRAYDIYVFEKGGRQTYKYAEMKVSAPEGVALDTLKIEFETQRLLSEMTDESGTPLGIMQKTFTGLVDAGEGKVLWFEELVQGSRATDVFDALKQTPVEERVTPVLKISEAYGDLTGRMRQGTAVEVEPGKKTWLVHPDANANNVFLEKLEGGSYTAKYVDAAEGMKVETSAESAGSSKFYGDLGHQVENFFGYPETRISGGLQPEILGFLGRRTIFDTPGSVRSFLNGIRKRYATTEEFVNDLQDAVKYFEKRRATFESTPEKSGVYNKFIRESVQVIDDLTAEQP